MQNILENLKGFRAIFTGGEGIGFDDLLNDIGHADLAEQILLDIDQTILLASPLQDPLEQELQENKELVLAFYYSLRNVTLLAKSAQPRQCTSSARGFGGCFCP